MSKEKIYVKSQLQSELDTDVIDEAIDTVNMFDVEVGDKVLLTNLDKDFQDWGCVTGKVIDVCPTQTCPITVRLDNEIEVSVQADQIRILQTHNGVSICGEWSDTLQAFWYGANNCEYIAYKGSHHIFVYPCDNYPNPPTEIWQHTERIETLRQFSEALHQGKQFNIHITPIE